MSGNLSITQLGTTGLQQTVGGAIALEVVGGAPGPAGPAGDSSIKINQLVASDSWTINHNLGRNPLVTVLSVGGVEVEATVTHTSLNQLIVSFNIPTAGSALLI